jgi:uncharacterized membrane protein/mono/diheme cytochrome c family protein
MGIFERNIASPTFVSPVRARIVVVAALLLSLITGPDRRLLADGPVTQANTSPNPSVAGPSRGPGIDRAIVVFRDHCIECHDADGRGDSSRDTTPKIPDFTDARWQQAREDRDLERSIVKGKGAMPRLKTKLTTEELRNIVLLVRDFRDGAFRLPDDDEEEVDKGVTENPGSRSEPNSPEPNTIKPARGFVAKLIGWLGNFHPPMVHFPIALLTGAALAELLRVITGRASFNSISRYCIWLGATSAVAAGVLGWFLAGLHLSDRSSVMMAHRWLGTVTVTGAALVLLLCEVSQNPGRRRARICFRLSLFLVAALVMVTGFTGGAVVFGLDHYAWPTR